MYPPKRSEANWAGKVVEVPFKLKNLVKMPYHFTQVPLVNVANENLQDDTSCKNGCP